MVLSKTSTSPTSLSICAVIVTFNRKALLMRTLSALYRQSRPIDKILIIDNASSDGTTELLEEQGYLQKINLIYHRLDSNTGGAGGFYTGVKQAFERGYDWLWLMDDDGYPTPDCLENLLNYKDDFDFYGPLVLSDDNKITLSFPITLPTTHKIVREKSQLPTDLLSNNILNDVLIPFNGVLLNAHLVEKIGFPEAKFFIWGDDMEYTKRARQAGAKIATISDIEFYHPTAPDLGTPMFFGKMQFNNTDSKIKLYCLCRNNTFNLKKYDSPAHAGLFMVKTLWFYTFTKPSFKKLKFCLSALKHGWQGDFTHHQAYIGKNFE